MNKNLQAFSNCHTFHLHETTPSIGCDLELNGKNDLIIAIGGNAKKCHIRFRGISKDDKDYPVMGMSGSKWGSQTFGVNQEWKFSYIKWFKAIRVILEEVDGEVTIVSQLN